MLVFRGVNGADPNNPYESWGGADWRGSVTAGEPGLAARLRDLGNKLLTLADTVPCPGTHARDGNGLTAPKKVRGVVKLDVWTWYVKKVVIFCLHKVASRKYVVYLWSYACINVCIFCTGLKCTFIETLICKKQQTSYKVDIVKMDWW